MMNRLTTVAEPHCRRCSNRYMRPLVGAGPQHSSRPTAVLDADVRATRCLIPARVVRRKDDDTAGQ
jgi:hypothetical protein